MNRQRTPAAAALFVAGLAFIGGCANPRGTATALSAVIPVSSAAASNTALSSPAVSSPAVTTSAPSSAPGSTHILESTQINGAVTGDSERQLLMTYTGGDCDTSARAEAVENGPTITVRVFVTTRNGVCDAVGHIRTVVAQLSAPWGNRAVLDSTGATVPVLDGALLLRPSWLPDGYQGGTVTAGPSLVDGKADELQEWGPRPVAATSTAAVPSCQSSPAALGLWQGYGITPGYPLLPGSYALADGTPVSVDRDDQRELGLFWTPPDHPTGWTVSLQAAQQCAGDQPLSLDTLMKIASGLH
jgi:hypothetical protein